MFWNRKKINRNTEIVIIGGGISGLVSGIYNLMNGNNVVIIEKNDTLGGKLQYSKYSKNFPKIVDGRIELMALLNEMQIDSNIVEPITEPLITYIDDEEIVEFPKTLNLLEEYLYSNCIDDKKKIKEFLSAIYQVKNNYKLFKKPYDLLSIFELGKEKKKTEVIRKIEKKYSTITIEHFFRKFNSSKIRELFTKIMSPNNSVSSLFLMLGSYYNNNLCYWKNDILELIIERYKELGGKYLLNKEAKEFAYSKLNRAYQVILDDARVISGDYFVSALDPYITYGKLLKNKFNNRSFYLRYEDYMNYHVDNRLIVCFETDKEFEYNNIVVDVNDIKINTSFIKNIKIVRNNKFIYCVINQNYNDYDYLKVLQSRKNLLEDNEKNIARDVKKIIEERFKNYSFKYKEIIDSISIENKMNCYRGALKGFISTPNGQHIYVNGVIPNLRNVFLSSAWLNSSGGILDAIISGKFSAERIEKEIENEKKKKI